MFFHDQDMSPTYFCFLDEEDSYMEKYEKIKRIGGGAFGIVWEALDKDTGEVIVIKQLKCKNIREHNALRQMNHPNIINLKESIVEDHIMYMALEHMESSLYERMINRSGNPFSEDEIRNLCFQVFQGLSYMHNNGYFHRDLKPENLLVTNNVIKIADFGEAGETNGKLPYTGYIGTRWYRAPEIILGARTHDSAVDMWAMGAIMAELFTLKPLFPGTCALDQMYKICSVIGRPTMATWRVGLQLADSMNYRFPEVPGVQLSEVLPSASLEAINLIDTLLSWNPGMRPTAMEALQHPFFYSCYEVPPTLLRPLVFRVAMMRESWRQITSSSGCPVESEGVDPKLQEQIDIIIENIVVLLED